MTRPTGVAATLAPDTALLPDARRLRTYGGWACCAGVAFFAIYPTFNWLTARREHRLHLYANAELAIPFVPQFIWAYISMYILFFLPLFALPAHRMPALGKQLVAGTIASGLLFLLFPAVLGFTRTLPADPLYAGMYSGIFGVDRPHNLVPSLHIVWSSLIILACADIARPGARALLQAWLAIIAASTVFVHQHHILDVVAAIPLVLLLRHRFRVPHVQDNFADRDAAAGATGLR